jgi:5-methylcytosine-specific restriction endonuclease McrA
VTYRSQGGPHEPWNLVTLCRCCHALAHTDKHRYQPALRALIWIQYTEGRYLTLPRVEALLATWEIP